jgi:hypothetical protein
MVATVWFMIAVVAIVTKGLVLFMVVQDTRTVYMLVWYCVRYSLCSAMFCVLRYGGIV